MSREALLVLNAGSSSIKFALFGLPVSETGSVPLCEGQLSDIGHRPHFRAHAEKTETLVDTLLAEGSSHEDALDTLLNWIGRQYADLTLVAAGHRVVHGGRRYAAPVRIDAEVLAELRRLIPLAPLHQPHHIAAIEALQQRHPALLQIACFDTAYHHEQPSVATAFALPRALHEEGIRRYGFHGLSYEYIASVLPQIAGGDVANGRVIVAHLGAGASLCAMLGRRSVATTMGFTALDGLPMSRRCGNLDPGVVLYLMQEKGMSAEAIASMLYNASGLLGVSGISDDMRTLLASDDVHAAQAIDLFIYRIRRELGSLAAALGGLDALVFTAGIGEHAAEIRRRVMEDAQWLGLEGNADANLAGGPRISSATSRVSAWVIATDEDLMIARHTQRVLSATSAF